MPQHSTNKMPQHSANKVTTEKTAAVPEAIPQQAPKNIRKEKPNAPEKGRVATSRTTEPRLAHRKCVAVLVITVINNITSSILTGSPHFQSSQIGSGEESDFPGENYEDDDSRNTPPQVDEVADPLFKPVFSLPTRDTVDSRTLGSRALNIIYFFVVYGKDEKMQKWVCKICG